MAENRIKQMGTEKGGRRMDVYATLAYMALGFFMGAVGQGARTIVGLKKGHDRARDNEDMKNWFDAGRFIVSLMIGGIAGSLGAVMLLGAEVDKRFLLTLVAIGYSGTDFIEGFMKRK